MRSGVLVNRVGPVASIDDALDELETASPPLLALSGEPGIGKSRLLAELAERAARRGHIVLEGRAAEFEGAVPFGLFVDALDGYLSVPNGTELDRLRADELAELAAIFPALQAAGEASALGGERYRAHRALRALLACLAAQRCLVLVLDDVHWADQASIEAIEHLVRRPSTSRVLLAIGYRPAQVDGRLVAELSAGESAGRVDTLDLAPFARRDAQLLIGRDVTADRLDVLYRESGGNPFYLEQLAQAGVGEPAVAESTGAAGEVPRSVIVAIEREIAALSDAGRALLHGGSVTGEPFELELACSAAQLSESDAEAALDELVLTGLVRATGAPTRFTFRHPIVRRAVYESAGVGWRIGAHRRLADALRGHGAAAVELAHHVEACAGRGDEGAIALLAEAGHAVGARAPALAARRFAAALALVPSTADGAERRLGLLVALANALVSCGQLAEGRHALLEALSLTAHDDPARFQLEAMCAAVEHLLGHHGQARARLLAALERLPRRRSAAGAAVLIELAADAVWMTEWDTVVARAGEASEIAERLGAPLAQATATALHALGLYCAGLPGQAREPLETARRLVDEASDETLAARLDAPYYLAWAEHWLERYEGAIAHAGRALALARATGQEQFLVMTQTAMAFSQLRLGRVAAGTETAVEALEAARLASHDQLMIMALVSRCWHALAEGELDIAIAAGEEAAGVAARHDSTIITASIGWTFGAALLEHGEPHRARETVLKFLGGPDAEGGAAGDRCLAWLILARAAAELGRPDEASEWAARCEALASALDGISLPRVYAGRARAAAELAHGRPAEAAAAALAAAATADKASVRLEASLARLDAGRALAAAGQRERAVAVLREASATFADCGARRWHDAADRELRRLGERVGRGGRRGSGERGVAALSARELEIAKLVSAGKSNKEIGADLFLAARTVETHLSNVFRKLGVKGRAAVGGELERARPTGAPPS